MRTFRTVPIQIERQKVVLMTSQHELPQVLLELVEVERLDPMDPELIAKRAALYMRNSQVLMLTMRGCELLQKLIDVFYADPVVKENLDCAQVAPDYPEIVGTGLTSASAYQDARDRVEEEIARLTRMKQPLPPRTATIREPELKY